MPWYVANEEEREFFAELASLPDRTVGLLAPVVVDNRLTSAIQATWHNIKRSGSDLFAELFRDGGQLGNFGTRIEIGFAIGLYGEDTYKDLRVLNRIRNNFAHRIGSKGFSTTQIGALAKNLKLPDRFPILPADAVRELPLNNPTLFEWTKLFCSYSSIEEADTPRNRFIRTAEILTVIFMIDGSPPRLVRRVPEF